MREPEPFLSDRQTDPGSPPIGDFVAIVYHPRGGLRAAAPSRADWLGRSGNWPDQGPERPVATVDTDGLELWSRGAYRRTATSAGGRLTIGLEPWASGAGDDPASRRGRFCVIDWQVEARVLTVWTDPFRSYPVHHARFDDAIVVASDARLVVAVGRLLAFAARVEPEAINHLLNFACIPAPLSAFAGLAKLAPAHRLVVEPGRLGSTPWWDSRYPADLTGDPTEAAVDLRERIVDTVQRHRPDGEAWGTFLSGGTDSSSISGILARQRPEHTVDSFSIGFTEPGYDEAAFSSIAVDHFDLRAHLRRVDEADAVVAIDRLARGCDEPFGNASAIPTYYCAAMAREHGKTLLVAGDGGDEIFGGNERYAKDRIFQAFHRAPAPLRATAGLLARGLAGSDNRLANRVKNFVRRGSLPNPDRLFSDDAFAADCFDALFDAGFRDLVDRDAPLEHLRGHYARADVADGPSAELNRLMYLDLKTAIADNDLVKVTRACRAAGVAPAFPYLDRDLIDHTGRLHASMKVRGLQKRWLFKQAMRGILPEAILAKKKQGFGLPIAVWLRRDGPYTDLVTDTVMSAQALGRGYFDAGFLRRLLQRHRAGAWDYSAEFHSLLMLELWHRHHVDR